MKDLQQRPVTRSFFRSRFILVLLIVSWLAAVGVGLGVMVDYETAPGQAGTPPARWPADSQVRSARGQATLIMFAHPHCPCTRASLGELALIMARAQGRVAAHVLFAKPPGFPDDWVESDLWQTAAAIPGVQVRADEARREARRFQTETSGHTVLYAADGRLLFHGGITAARGHSGDNAGRSAISALLTEGTADRSETFVFGCPLFESELESDATQCPPGAKSCKTLRPAEQ
jgi:hypothetical protein